MFCKFLNRTNFSFICSHLITKLLEISKEKRSSLKTDLFFFIASKSFEGFSHLLSWRQSLFSFQWTALHFAARYGTVETVKYLVDKGADLSAENKYNVGFCCVNCALNRNRKLRKYYRVTKNFIRNIFWFYGFFKVLSLFLCQ